MPKPEPEIGNMTNPLLSGEETAKLVERLQTRASNWERIGADDHAALDRQAAALLTTQASEIERLRGEPVTSSRNPAGEKIPSSQGGVSGPAPATGDSPVGAGPTNLETDRERLKARAIDYCMCGDRMDTHTVYSGHSPVSQYDYRLDQAEATVASQAVRIAELEKDNARKHDALKLITQQDPKPSNSPDPGHEHYLRLVLISIAKTALGDGTLKDNITAARTTLAAQQDQKEA